MIMVSMLIAVVALVVAFDVTAVASSKYIVERNNY